MNLQAQNSSDHIYVYFFTSFLLLFLFVIIITNYTIITIINYTIIITTISVNMKMISKKSLSAATLHGSPRCLEDGETLL